MNRRRQPKQKIRRGCHSEINNESTRQKKHPDIAGIRQRAAEHGGCILSDTVPDMLKVTCDNDCAR
jgi:hypothetical protein